MIALESLASCFQGLLPAWLFTCSRDGVPNVAMLSHVDYVDARHVALSFQFFNKSRRNIDENPRATVRLYEPDTLQTYALRLRYVRTETEGATFERMRLRIEAIASHSGLKGIFRLLGADVYEVLDVARVDGDAGLPAAVRPAAAPAVLPFDLCALRELSDSLRQAPTLDALLDGILETLERLFGFRHSMILLASEHPERLELIASRGYPPGGVGSEVGFGEGIIGMVAEARKPISIPGMMRHMLYAYAVARRAEAQGVETVAQHIPLPGLPNPQAQIGIPLVVQDELLGVLCIETEDSYRFHEEDRAYLEVLGGYLAIGVQNALLRERQEDRQNERRDERGHAGDGGTPAAAPPDASPAARSLAVTYYRSDECILVDGEYLVRGLPARILWKLLNERLAGDCEEFTNRRLRLDKSLELPAFKDNLESRLILLRRRLAERCPDIRLAQSGRGRFRLELSAAVELAEQP